MRLNPENLQVESYATTERPQMGAASSMTYSDCSCVCLAPTCMYEVCG
jgi:hypothetical protein